MTRNELCQTWEIRIADLQSSGQSIPVWSATHNLKIHQVRYWLRKLKLNSQPTANPTPQKRLCSNSET
jgi:hypothetical protein